MKQPGKKLSASSREAVLFYIFVSPFILSFILLKIFPMIYAVYISFTNATGFNWGNLRVIGFRNYARILQDKDVIYSVWRTFYVAIVFVPLQLVAINLTALLLTRDIKGVGFYRTIYYIPSIVPVVATGAMWMQLYNKNTGIFSQFLGYLGISVNFLDYNWVTRSMIFMMLWGLGTGLLVTIAAIKNVPRELYEAAEIDGAKSFSQFRKITLPLITPVNLYNLLMGIIGTLQIYIQPVMITPTLPGTQGGILQIPLKPNYLYLVHIYQQIFSQQRYGYGMALVWLLFIVVVGLTLIVLKTSKKWVYYEVDQEGGK